MGHTLTAVTIYLSLVSYLLAVVCWVSKRRGQRYRVLWTIGCVSLWLHAASAFHFYHGWSHADAVRETAEQTEAILGVPLGEGIWFSYLLMVVWLADVVLMWRSDANIPAGSGCLSLAVHAYAFFILFNGTVVFEDGVVRWAGVVGVLWLARLAWRHRGYPIKPSNMEEAS